MGIAQDLAPTGTLRVSINLGNPVLAQGTAASPGGVSVDLARDLGARLDLPVQLVCFTAARDSFAALRDGRTDLGFLAVDPARETELAFTAPYAILEGVYAARPGTSLASAADVDVEGVRVGVKDGSAYDLFLTRTLERAELVRGSDGTNAADEFGCEIAAGIRVPLTDWVATRDGWTILEPAFMEILQAVAVPRATPDGAVDYVRRFVEERKADGFVEESLKRSGRRDAQVAPTAPTADHT